MATDVVAPAVNNAEYGLTALTGTSASCEETLVNGNRNKIVHDHGSSGVHIYAEIGDGDSHSCTYPDPHYEEIEYRPKSTNQRFSLPSPVGYVDMNTNIPCRYANMPISFGAAPTVASKHKITRNPTQTNCEQNGNVTFNATCHATIMKANSEITSYTTMT